MSVHKLAKPGLIASLTLALVLASGCSSAGDGGSSDSGSTTNKASNEKLANTPDVKCDVPKANLDDSKIDTSKVTGGITFMTQNLKKDFSPFFEKVIADFEKANPGTKITWQDKPGGPQFDKLMTADAVQCQMADVINVPAQTVLALSKPNLLMDLDTKAPGIGDKFIKDLWDGSAIGYKGHHTALPWYVVATVTSYNKAVFERNGLDPKDPPKTMTQQFEMGHKIAKANKGDYALYGNANWYLSGQLLSMGAKLMNDDQSKFIFADDPHALEWVTQMASLYKEGAIPKDSLTGEPDANKAYFEGNLAIGTPNPSFLRAVRKNNPKVYAETAVSAPPSTDGAKNALSVQYIGVSVTTKNAPLALKFAEYMTNAENELAWTRDGGAIIFPPAKEALDKIENDPPKFTNDAVFKEAYKFAADSVRNGKLYPSQLYINGSVQKALVDNINKGVRGEVDPKTALKNAQDKMNSLLQRANQ